MRTEALLVPPMLAVLCGCTAAHAVKPEDIQQCLNVAQDNGLVMVSTEERSRLLPDLVHQIESSQAMKPNEAPEYRQLIFRSDRKLLLCELGPCLPVRWIFESTANGWVLSNRPEGLCVS